MFPWESPFVPLGFVICRIIFWLDTFQRGSNLSVAYDFRFRCWPSSSVWGSGGYSLLWLAAACKGSKIAIGCNHRKIQRPTVAASSISFRPGVQYAFTVYGRSYLLSPQHKECWGGLKWNGLNGADTTSSGAPWLLDTFPVLLRSNSRARDCTARRICLANEEQQEHWR